MKVSKKTGRIKLGVDEIMVDGRYFVKREPEHMKLSDLNFAFHVRFPRRLGVGAWLENMWSRASRGEAAAERTLRTYAATIWSVLSVVPDDAFVEGALLAVDGAMERSPSLYGIASEEEAEGQKENMEDRKDEGED